MLITSSLIAWMGTSLMYWPRNGSDYCEQLVPEQVLLNHLVVFATVYTNLTLFALLVVLLLLNNWCGWSKKSEPTETEP